MKYTQQKLFYPVSEQTIRQLVSLLKASKPLQQTHLTGNLLQVSLGCKLCQNAVLQSIKK